MMPGQLFEHNNVHTHAKQQDVTCLFSTTIFSNVGSYKKSSFLSKMCFDFIIKTCMHS